MTHPNEALLRTGYDAFATGDIPTVLGIFDQNITWSTGGNNSLTGHYKGHDEVVGFFTRIIELTGGNFSLHIERVIADDTGAAVLCTARGTRDGAEHSGQVLHVWTIEDGRATSFEEFTNGAEDELFA